MYIYIHIYTIGFSITMNLYSPTSFFIFGFHTLNLSKQLCESSKKTISFEQRNILKFNSAAFCLLIEQELSQMERNCKKQLLVPVRSK